RYGNVRRRRRGRRREQRMTGPKQNARPLRTALFIAGSEEHELAEAASHRADAIVVDIEEPRTPFPRHERERTRKSGGEVLDSAPTGPGAPLWFVRVQPIDTGMTLRDLQAVMRPALTGVLLPKIQTAIDVASAAALLDCMEVETGRERGSTAIYP